MALAKYDKSPHFAPSELGMIFMQGAKCMYPRDGAPDEWILQKFSNHAETCIKLILTEMKTSKVYEEALKRQSEEEPKPKKTKKSNEVQVIETLTATVEMGGKKPARPTMILDDVHFMIRAAQLCIVDGDDAREGAKQIVKDLGASKTDRPSIHILSCVWRIVCFNFCFRCLCGFVAAAGRRAPLARIQIRRHVWAGQAALSSLTV